MADIPLEPHQVSDTQERTLQAVVDELKELNDSTQAEDNARYTQELRDYVTTHGDSLSASQITAIEDLITAVEGNNLADMEKSFEEIKRDDERNELLEQIAKYTSLSLDAMKEEFDGKSRGFIMNMLIRTALIGLIKGFGMGMIDGLRAMGKGFAFIGSRIGKLLKLDVLFKNIKSSVGTALKGFRTSITGIFGGSGKPGTFGKIFARMKIIFNALARGFRDVQKLLSSAITVTKAIIGATIAFMTGAFAALKSLQNIKAPKFVTKLGQNITKVVTAFFKPMQGFFKLFNQMLAPIQRSFNLAGRQAGATSKVARNIGTTITKFFGSLKPIQTAFKVLGAVGKAFFGLGRVLGRFFTIFTFITGFFKGFSQFDGNFFEKAFAGFVEGIKQVILIGPAFIADGFKWLLTKVLSFFNMDEAVAYLESFTIREKVTEFFDFVRDSIIGFFRKISDAISEIGVMGLIKNAMLEVAKIFKKIILFPKAVAAGAMAAIGGAFDPRTTAAEGFKKGFNKVFTLGDDAIDNLKSKAEGDKGAGEGAEMQKLSEENSRFDAMREGFGNFIGDIGNRLGVTNNDNSQTQVIVNDQGLIPKNSAF